jgi:hypothetical protein
MKMGQRRRKLGHEDKKHRGAVTVLSKNWGGGGRAVGYGMDCKSTFR